MDISNAQIKAKERTFLPKDFSLSTWEALQPYFEQLEQRTLDHFEALQQWLKDISELEAVIGEEACWRQIRMTCDTTNTAYEEAFTYFITAIEPQMKPYIFVLNKKLLACPFHSQLDKTKFFPFLRSVQNSIALYREENIELQSQMALLAQQYGSICAAMTITLEDQTYTLQQASKFLHDADRNLRKTVFEKITNRRLQDKEALDQLFDKLIALRHQVALNAGFENYRDYKFKELGRFDYGPKECFEFHDAVKKYIVPLQKELLEAKKNKLGLEVLKPYDTEAEPANTKALQPFENGKELLEKAIKVFQRLDPFFGACLEKMQQMERLDLDSRVGKAPGGYNCPLPETGVPFIFMNAAGTVNDLITMMHEGGHALHSFLSHPLELSAFKEYPMEIAELASMSMELFSMEYWNEFFSNTEELRRAQWEELERVIDVLPWIAIIDKFQHWIYTNPQHKAAERNAQWLEIVNEFSTGIVDWSDFSTYQNSYWQKQLHLFEVPFYYIEYGIAQLGALAMWRQYKANPKAALENYCKALKLGYTQTLKELYQTAGISFDFSAPYIQELAAFVQTQLNVLQEPQKL